MPSILLGCGTRYTHAVRDFSWSCAQGEVFGLLGVNGAGKTTMSAELRVLE